MSNDTNQPAPQHMGSQSAPAGNHTGSNNQPMEKQMLELRRQEKEVRKMQESLKGAVTMDSLKERAKSDRNAVLKELGFDDLIKEDPNDPIAALKKQIEDMQNQTKMERSQKERAERLEALKSELSNKPDDYELLNTLGYHDQVFERMESYQPEDGESPDVHTFAKQLEDLLFQQISSAKATKKVSGLFQPEPKPNQQAKHPLDQSTTISSNDRTSTQPSSDNAPTMTRQQLLEQAAKHIKFNS